MSTTRQQFDLPAVRDCLRRRDFRTLFREYLGWDHDSGELAVEITGKAFALMAVAQKRGFRILHCPQIPTRPVRIKIDNKITAAAYEHLIIFTHGDEQIWQWTRREPGRPAASRSFTIAPGQSGEALLQKLRAISFSLDEEDSITIAAVASRARAALDVETVTKRFYTQFTAEHSTLLTLIKGIAGAADLQWYSSLMLNRLMFIYFIQKKGFLDNNVEYLRHRLNLLQQRRGKDKFHSFYRYFLLRLFHDGLGKAPAQRDPEMEQLLGKVPYLNGGFFEVHQLEQKYPDIDIPDEAFQKLFDFFDRYRWHLDERPRRAENEINPDVVGYIFEKYINQKQMGAYYTKEDITEYISKNTILPFLFDAAKNQCPIAFKPGSYLWRLLGENPDRYIYTAVRKGVIHDDGTIFPESELPDFVQVGMNDPNARMFDKRYNLSQAETADPIRLPTETWREYIARRTRCLKIRAKLHAGEVHDINDLITLNLDIWQFARDAISKCEGPELLRAFWNAIREVTVLDPTCGSGAFLFAALRILETLYEDCLGRMEGFISEAAPAAGPEKFSDFRALLAQMDTHPSESYFVLKSIIINNLFGVDIMPEAVEICKLRLFLKLAAQAQTFEQIEPLPDIDFNIRSGNTLVGYATLESLKKGQEGKLLFSAGELADIERSAIGAARIFTQFKDMQTQTANASEIIVATKTAMRQALAKLADRLDRYLAGEYSIDVEQKPTEFEKWKSSHQPFHWFTEFYGVMSRGGFDVIIGNPPYLELAQIDYVLKGFDTVESKAVHAACVERGLGLMQPAGAASMILPLSIVCTQRMIPLQKIVEQRGTAWYANFAWRPGKLFDAVNRALTIFVVNAGGESRTFSTGYKKWNAESRADIFPLVRYSPVPRQRGAFWVPKIQEQVEASIMRKLMAAPLRMLDFKGTGGATVFYRTDGGLYWKVFTDFAPAFQINGKRSHSTRETSYRLKSGVQIRAIIALLSSGLFWWWYTVTSNLRHLNPSDIEGFPAHVNSLNCSAIENLGRGYLESLVANSTMLTREQKQTGKTETQCFKVQNCKPIIDEIDRILAEHYGFTPEELDFIINYDIKYRMGAENVEINA
jgi:hypothetical protein